MFARTIQIISNRMNNISFGMHNMKFSQYLFMNKSFNPLNNLREFSKHLNLHQNSQNPFLEKYASKIAEVQKVSPESFKQSLRENLKQVESSSYTLNNIPRNVQKDSRISHFQRQKNLSQVMKIESVQDKTAEEIETIWNEYHKVKDGVYAVLPVKSFDKMYLNMKEYPVFLFPLPRAQGYEFIMCQFLDQSCYFTSLINYQAFKENAPICLTVTYFTELDKDKGIVLMRGEYDNSIKAHEAQCLTNQLQLYYGGQDEEKNKLLWKFNKQPDTFKHMDLISDFESSLGH